MYKKGKILKKIKGKLEKASKAHASQAKAIGKVLSPQKKMIGGLLTKGIKKAIKKLGKKTINLQRDEMARSIKQHRKLGFGTAYRTKDMKPLDLKIKRLKAKEDMRVGILTNLKNKKDKAKIRASRMRAMGKTIDVIGQSMKAAKNYRKKLN